MSEKFRIITHTGKAHMDELVASALLTLVQDRQPDEIIRQENRDTEALIAAGQVDEGDWVLDCGLVHDPSHRLYDHHQDGSLPSTAYMIFEEFFPELHGSRLHDSLELLSRVDTGGLQSLNDYDALDESASYWSFSQKMLLKGFETDPAAAVLMVSRSLQDSIEFERMRNKGLQWLENSEHTRISEIEGVKVLSYMVRPPEELTSALRSADKVMVDEFGISAIYSFDDSAPGGRALFRTISGQNTLDFSLSEPSSVIFCHPGGFLLKFVPSEEEEWIRIIRESLKES